MSKPAYDGAMPALQIRDDVATAIASGRPVVALESTIISHGLPRPDNLRVAREVEGIVRSAGAVPATIAVVDGVAVIGLDDAQLIRVAGDDDVAKLSVRDVAVDMVHIARDGGGGNQPSGRGPMGKRPARKFHKRPPKPNTPGQT